MFFMGVLDPFCSVRFDRLADKLIHFAAGMTYVSSNLAGELIEL